MELTTIRGINRYDDQYISFEAEASDLLNDYSAYEKYVKGCQTVVRNDNRYTSYINKLKSGGVGRCAILGRLPDTDKLSTEMHHGPIFNLFDVCDIVLRYQLRNNPENITTFDIGDIVLSEHEADNVMVVMLSKTVHHGGAHGTGSKGIFIDIKATFGRIDRFIEKYNDGMIAEHWQYVDKYITECKKTPITEDNGLFDVASSLKEFK